ncbi:alanyl-tRNA editing protein [Edaphobacter flagellatus]|uniref:hypothetical protein n=1 Tax=Edaphobacter flagellatus TaxID=1933044 RepID=UPI0021B28435|nr:hypothetical protein [Edaphobacter flagellatus]
MSFSAVVVDILEESRVAGLQRWQILLDHTEFGVGDTGELEAVAKSGARLVIPVLEVVRDGSQMWHLVEKPITVGTVIRAEVSGAGEE